jgi:peptidyl-tRNA hydrolase
MLEKLKEKKAALEATKAAILEEAEKIQAKIGVIQELIEEENLNAATEVESETVTLIR